ncbi:hypothetical protein F4212_04970 [Candidatus Poribacteria bacterium]|nr:hypothetical protein [Candidatus Poribacteria bacterium]
MDLVITSVLTFIVTLLVILVRNRRALLTYHVRHDRIGVSTYDNIHGEVLVTVGDSPVQNLYMSNVWLVNRSMRDVENLEVKVWTGNEQMQLMTEKTHIEGTVEFLKHTAEYEDMKKSLQNSIEEIERARAAGDDVTAAQIHQTQAANWEMWSNQRWYEVPVLARGQTIRFTYMTNILSDVDPVIFISCQKAGIRVKYKQPYQPIWHLWGVPLVEASFTGTVIGILVWLVVINSISILWLAALLCLFVGLLAGIPGAAGVRLYRWLQNRLVG